MRKVIRLHDSTNHGGRVTSVAATHFTIGGIAVARVGDRLTCPLHGDSTIIEGDPHHTIDGVSVAYEGHKTSCGALLQASGNNFGHR